MPHGFTVAVPGLSGRHTRLNGYYSPAGDEYEVYHPRGGCLALRCAYGSAQRIAASSGAAAFISCRGAIVPRVSP